MSKIFGIGLSRTGTKSLAVALNMLGIRTRWYPNDYQTYSDIVSGRYRMGVLENYDAITDTPAVPFYPHFDELFPGSKFILTIRDKQSWIESCRRHWGENPNAPVPHPSKVAPVRHFGNFIDLIVYGSFRFNERRWSYVFDRHTESVKSYFRDRPSDLLVIDFTKGEGWEELCPFLGKEPPDELFPKINQFRHKLLG